MYSLSEFVKPFVAFLLMALTNSITYVLVSRGLSGFGGSLLMISGIIYMAEVSHPANRELLGCVAGVLINAGEVYGSTCVWPVHLYTKGVIIIIITILLKKDYKIQLADKKVQMAWLTRWLVVG